MKEHVFIFPISRVKIQRKYTITNPVQAKIVGPQDLGRVSSRERVTTYSTLGLEVTGTRRIYNIVSNPNPDPINNGYLFVS